MGPARVPAPPSRGESERGHRERGASGARPASGTARTKRNLWAARGSRARHRSGTGSAAARPRLATEAEHRSTRSSHRTGRALVAAAPPARDERGGCGGGRRPGASGCRRRAPASGRERVRRARLSQGARRVGASAPGTPVARPLSPRAHPPRRHPASAAMLERPPSLRLRDGRLGRRSEPPERSTKRRVPKQRHRPPGLRRADLLPASLGRAVQSTGAVPARLTAQRRGRVRPRVDWNGSFEARAGQQDRAPPRDDEVRPAGRVDRLRDQDRALASVPGALVDSAQGLGKAERSVCEAYETPVGRVRDPVG